MVERLQPAEQLSLEQKGCRVGSGSWASGPLSVYASVFDIAPKDSDACAILGLILQAPTSGLVCTPE
jgi:hypothetical protein